MKTYRVYATYVVEVFHDVQAESKEDAWDKTYSIDCNAYTINQDYEGDDWQIDRIEDIE
jgi:hypothetical protein